MVQDLKGTKGATQQLKISGVVECPGKSCHRDFKVGDIMSDLPMEEGTWQRAKPGKRCKVN
jgi:hypothetical protein